jgi:hypothetical protein
MIMRITALRGMTPCSPVDHHLFSSLKYFYHFLIPNVLLNWVHLLLHIWKFSGSSLRPETVYPNIGTSWFSSFLPDKCRYSTTNYVTNLFLPRHIKFTHFPLSNPEILQRADPFLGNGSVNTFPLQCSRFLILQPMDYKNHVARSRGEDLELSQSCPGVCEDKLEPGGRGRAIVGAVIRKCPVTHWEH